jgi:hypothetical protein
MPLKIVTAEERLLKANLKSSCAIFGPPGVGKTHLLTTLPAEKTVCFDLEAGLKSVQDWQGASIPIRDFVSFRKLAILVGGPDPAAHRDSYYGEAYHAAVRDEYRDTGLEEFLASRPILFIDSITELTRQAMAYAKQQPEAFSEKTGKPDVRGAYGLLGREVIQSLKHFQHAPGKTVIFVGVLEKVTDDFNQSTWQSQLEGTKAARELPGIVDQVMSMHLFSQKDDGSYILDEKSSTRRLVCQAGNLFGLPAKDRSGRLDVTEPPDLGAVLAKINGSSGSSRPTPG